MTDYASSLSMHPVGVAEPVNLDAKLGERLLKDPTLTTGPIDPYRTVRHAAAQNAANDWLVAIYMPLLAEIVN